MSNMEKIYKVFISSTYDDLIEERKEVSQAIIKCGCLPVGMELFQASNKKKWETIKRVIDDSDFYILIIAGRYGSLCIDDNGRKIGVTEREYNYAVSLKKPILVFVHKNPETLSAKFVERNKNSIQWLKKFREKAMNDCMVAFWENKDLLHGAVLDSLNKAIKETPEAIGWVRATNRTDSKTEEPSFSIDIIIAEFEHIDSSNEQIKFLNSLDSKIQTTIFNNEYFVRKFLLLLDTNNTESIIWQAIMLIPHHSDLDYRILNIIHSEAKIIGLFKQLYEQAEQQTTNDLLILIIRLLIKIDYFNDDYSIPIFNIIKSDTTDTKLKKTCFNYCKILCGKVYENEVAKNIVDYILCRLKNKEQLIPKDEWIDLLLSSCSTNDDIKTIHEVFFDNDNETKRFVLDSMFNYCGTDMYIYDIRMQKLFFEICDEVYSWNDDDYTSRLLVYCLLNRTNDIFTVDEIYEKINAVNDNVFYMFFQSIQHEGFYPNYENNFILDDDERERIKGIIKLRNHPRGKKLLELFKYSSAIMTDTI